jgi:hypothetical protein
MKSAKEGPELRVSVKVVVGRRVPCGEMVARLRSVTGFGDIERSGIARLRRQGHLLRVLIMSSFKDRSRSGI